MTEIQQKTGQLHNVFINNKAHWRWTINLTKNVMQIKNVLNNGPSIYKMYMNIVSHCFRSLRSLNHRPSEIHKKVALYHSKRNIVIYRFTFANCLFCEQYSSLKSIYTDFGITIFFGDSCLLVGNFRRVKLLTELYRWD